MLSPFYRSLLLGALATVVKSQQDAGVYVPNKLPLPTGASTHYWNIASDLGTAADFTLVNIANFNQAGGVQNKTLIKRAVICIHGFLNDPEYYMMPMLEALGDVEIDNADINNDAVAIVVPLWASPATDRGLVASDNAGAPGLIWEGYNWFYGAQSIYPSNTSSVSSFSVVDQIIQEFDNKELYPNMQNIVIAGHSMGSMFVNRYAAYGKQLGTSAALTYYIADPNDYIWFNDERPLSTASCPTFNDYSGGTDNYGTTNSYNLELASQGAAAVQANYNSRTFAYARATRDKGDFAYGCSPYTIGSSRYDRFFAFIEAFPVSCDVDAICNTIDYVVSGHNAETMFTSEAGQMRLFMDGFDGTPKAYDYYYPRLGTNDDPYPNPALAVAGDK